MRFLKNFSVESICFAVICLMLAVQVSPLSTTLVSKLTPNVHQLRSNLLDAESSDAAFERIVSQDIDISINGRTFNATLGELSDVESPTIPTTSTISITPDESAASMWKFVAWCALAGFSFILFGRGLGIWILAGVFCLGIFEAAYGIAHINGGSSLGFQEKSFFIGSATGTFVSKNHFAALIYLAMGASISLFLAAQRRRLIGSGILLLTVAMLLSLSRGGIIAAGIAVWVIWPSLSKKKAFSPYARRILPVVLIAGAALSGVVTRFGRLLDGDSSLTGRLNIWGDSLELWRMSPVFGNGLGSFDDTAAMLSSEPMVFRFAHAHSEPLQLLAEGGLVVLIPSLFLVYTLSKKLFLNRRNENSAIYIGLCFSLVSLALQSLIDFPLRNELIAALAAIMVGGLVSEGGYVTTRSSTRLSLSAAGLLVMVLTITSGLTDESSGPPYTYGSIEQQLIDIANSPANREESIEELQVVIRGLNEEVSVRPLAPEIHSQLAYSYALLFRIARDSNSPQTDKSAEWYESLAEIHIQNMVSLQPKNPRIYLRSMRFHKVMEDGNPIWRAHREHRLTSIEATIALDPWLASHAFADADDLGVSEIKELRIDNPRGEYERGRALLRIGEVDAALVSFRSAAASLSDWAPAFFMIGEACRMQGDSVCYVDSYLESLSLEPSNPVMKGWAQHWTGASSVAVETFTAFLENNPGHTWATQGLNSALQGQSAVAD